MPFTIKTNFHAPHSIVIWVVRPCQFLFVGEYAAFCCGFNPNGRKRRKLYSIVDDFFKSSQSQARG
jgi:hypothetical protein